MYQFNTHSERPMVVPKRRAVEKPARARLVSVEGLDGGESSGIWRLSLSAKSD